MSQNLTSWGGVCTSPANTIPNRLTTTTNTQNMQSRIRMFLSKRVKVMWPVGSLEVEEVLSPSTVILTSLTVKLRFSEVVVALRCVCEGSTKSEVASGGSVEVNSFDL